MDGDDTPETAFVVPVSWFHTIDFNTLMDPGGSFVIEKWKVHHLSSARDLLDSVQETPQGVGLLAIGNPTHTNPTPEANERRGPEALCVDRAAIRDLPGSEQETRAIAQLFQSHTEEPATVLLGTESTEESVKAMIQGKRIAHFATHGYYCGEPGRDVRAHSYRLVDPLLQSGLVLSNIDGDGLLTAQELVCLDLRSLDWVVLSACGSGLGRLVAGEGTFGLRRAFEIAGAGTVVTALWEIGDSQTRSLMSEIYRRRLSGASTIDAIRRAQLDRLRHQRLSLNRIHPTLWGGIIAEGDWR
jgi:CHAT domain-containing protein